MSRVAAGPEGRALASATSSLHDAISHLKIVIVDGVYTDTPALIPPQR
ncbi:MAG: hypothetical protein J2P27_00415 [Actinobacteria bacterium]|nr:hypothetical protein [Actinomycetota bacterium]